MASKKLTKSGQHCKRHGHTMRFFRYLTERDYRYPANHEKYTPKEGLFKCCNCNHQEVMPVKIRYSGWVFTGEEISANGFYFFKKKDRK